MGEQFDHGIEEVLGIEDADGPAGGGGGGASVGGAADTAAGTADVDHEQLRRAEHEAHAIAGAIYGTILASTVVAALGHSPEKLEKSILIVVVTSAVFYLAHVYSLVVAARMVARRRLTGSEVRGVAVAEWPMLQSSVPILVPLFFGAFGWISRDTASYLAVGVGIGALFVYGVLLGVRERRGALSILINALVVGSFGVLILLLKVFVH